MVWPGWSNNDYLLLEKPRIQKFLNPLGWMSHQSQPDTEGLGNPWELLVFCLQEVLVCSLQA